eukprot:TRINITY_DN61228_c0_g1_i1.p1 TRINITY_DN61228_c0_g1~~TRINITY_DN61228_c0_g1_i1.p1  ORF type:complete len:247 (+),score=33.62 TRINITY_DN61228_c0_g1_i1:45-785(+)
MPALLHTSTCLAVADADQSQDWHASDPFASWRPTQRSSVLLSSHEIARRPSELIGTVGERRASRSTAPRSGFPVKSPGSAVTSNPLLSYGTGIAYGARCRNSDFIAFLAPRNGNLISVPVTAGRQLSFAVPTALEEKTKVSDIDASAGRALVTLRNLDSAQQAAENAQAADAHTVAYGRVVLWVNVALVIVAGYVAKTSNDAYKRWRENRRRLADAWAHAEAFVERREAAQRDAPMAPPPPPGAGA